MGGGGGGGGSRASRAEMRSQLDDARRNTRDEAYETACASLLDTLLARFNNRDRPAIDRHLAEIVKALGKEVEGTIQLSLAGSVAKHTYVDGLSDVDCLVKLDNCELATGSPNDAKAYLLERLRERFPNTDVAAGKMAVTVTFKDAEVQLLPAVSCNGAVQITDETGERWAQIKPDAFARALTETNSNHSGKAVPTIKLAKAIIANLPEQQRISGYHAESIAVNVFRDYEGPNRTKDMLQHFFVAGAKAVLDPITDRTGQSLHVDDYLGAGGTVGRRVVSDAFARVARKMESGNAASDVDNWKDLFTE